MNDKAITRLSVHTVLHPFNMLGTATAPIVGGNLCMMAHLIGSANSFDTAGKLLFIEDIAEQPYHIDRMMLNLKRSGKLANLAGLIVGGMSEMRDNTIPFGMTAEEIIIEAVAEYDYPVCFNFPAGHISDNNALIMGRNVYLNVTDSVVLKFDI